MAEAFDTHKAYLELTNGDRFEHAQAEALIALVNGAVVGSVATKSDIEILENKLENSTTTLRSEIEILENKLDNGMAMLRSAIEILENKLDNGMAMLRSEIENSKATLRSEIENIKNYLLFRIVLAQIGGMGILFGLIKFFD